MTKDKTVLSLPGEETVEEVGHGTRDTQHVQTLVRETTVNTAQRVNKL